jgi:poly(hydroxyalkanoate) depolymerase family esterase
MASLTDTVAHLAKLRKTMANTGQSQGSTRLRLLDDFGSNPGALQARHHLPKDVGAKAPLVVVLHGCTQTAAGYDRGSGWSELADRHGFAVLLPEQQRANNPNLCFNWFAPGDSARDQGEALSIKQMIDTMKAKYDIDPARIYVTGLSAGGAMTSVMLTAYPELFAGGAIIAGLPFGVASSVPQAMEHMRGGQAVDAAALAKRARSESGHNGRWPIVSIWHGSADATVNVANARTILDQWRILHGAKDAPDHARVVDGVTRRVWIDASGREIIEEFIVPGMGHGTPLDPSANDSCGVSGAFMLDVGISSTHHIARFFGLLDGAKAQAAAPIEPRVNGTLEAVNSPVPAPSTMRKPRPHTAKPMQPEPAVGGIGAVIENALRSAGLVR